MASGLVTLHPRTIANPPLEGPRIARQVKPSKCARAQVFHWFLFLGESGLFTFNHRRSFSYAIWKLSVLSSDLRVPVLTVTAANRTIRLNNLQPQQNGCIPILRDRAACAVGTSGMVTCRTENSWMDGSPCMPLVSAFQQPVPHSRPRSH